MNKIKKIGLILVFALAALEPFALSSSVTDGIEWVEKCTALHPEILWLADANVRKTEEGYASAKGTYSEQLFGQKYVEFDRTIMTLECLKLLVDGSKNSYQIFTSAQKEHKLSYESFLSLHNQAKRLLRSRWGGLSELQMAETLETALVLGDIGKSEKAREIFKPYGVNAIDHDDFHRELMQVLTTYPNLCPSFARLPITAQKLLVKSANLAHYGHITHLEGNAGMFSKLKESEIAFQDPLALVFDLFVHTCDVAGALGHVNNISSLVYTELTHRSMQAMWEAVKTLRDPHKTELDAYNAYLAKRASWLDLDPQNPTDRVLTRIGAMLRLFTPAEGMILRKAILSLGEEREREVIAALDISKNDLSGRTPTYMPAVIVNLANNSELGSCKEERLSKAVTIGLPFIAKVLKEHQEMLLHHAISSNIPLNFNQAAKIAKESPHLLETGKFAIDEEGTVYLIPEETDHS
jgi:hypothetical protein